VFFVKQKITSGYEVIHPTYANHHTYAVYSGTISVSYKGIFLDTLKLGSIFRQIRDSSLSFEAGSKEVILLKIETKKLLTYFDLEDEILNHLQ